MRLPLFVEKILQCRFGVDADEFLSKGAIEAVNVGCMNAEAVVHHREITDTFGVKAIDGEHHVCGIQRMHEMGDDAVRLLPRVDLPRLILLIHNERAIRCLDTWRLRLPRLMNHCKTRRRSTPCLDSPSRSRGQRDEASS